MLTYFKISIKNGKTALHTLLLISFFLPVKAGLAGTPVSTIPANKIKPSITLSPEIKRSISDKVSTSHKGLIIKKAKQGDMIQLQGRFQHAPIAVVDEKGKIIMGEFSSELAVIK